MREGRAMRRRSVLVRFVVLAVCAAGLLSLPATASADHATRPHTPNLQALGYAPFPATLLLQPDGVRKPNSDLAFWRDLVFHGNYDGFRTIRSSTLDVIVEIERRGTDVGAGIDDDAGIGGDVVVLAVEAVGLARPACLARILHAV
jgi:hypothetical protein